MQRLPDQVVDAVDVVAGRGAFALEGRVRSGAGTASADRGAGGAVAAPRAGEAGKEVGSKAGKEAGSEVDWEVGSDGGAAAAPRAGEAGNEVGSKAGKEVGSKAGKEAGSEVDWEVGSDVEASLRVLQAFVTAHRSDAERIVEAADRGTSFGTDGGAFAFPDVSGQDGVVVEVAPGAAVLVSEAAFGRLVERMRRALTGE